MKIFKTFILNCLNFLKIPELKLPKEAIEEFDTLYNDFVSEGKGDFFEYKSSYPKYLFLNYLIENKTVLVHGSNHSDIKIFEPRDSTLFTGKPVKAVFASSDGVWSMFFAVIKRSGYRGTIRNACFTNKTKNGIKRYYFFSVNEEYKNEPWTDGTIYILPKPFFKQGGVNDEWICEMEVKPLAKLSVTPKDFIFLDQVNYHNEKDSTIKTFVKAVVLNRK
ncbi:hypothetical protein RCG23_09425 [Neobacillus sp. PS3-34]|uniref:hypothetical protein n=1 Tax=Neobacillus sp. PS3-34 TaxID=3070678 RepID=UPI0027E09ACA|nr:hypothetical protein [Neobacillus sp. PS3-34]WML50039.1 hypothetical protein RCG23_09425 [Neobacillus sp. PS3-34]